MTDEPGEVLPCPVCKQPVERGQWFILASEAPGTMRHYSRITGLRQRPVHLACLTPFDPVEKTDADDR